MKTLVAMIMLSVGSPTFALQPPCTELYCPPVPGLMTPRELATQPARPADARVTYGADASQFVELRVPGGDGPHPVVVLIHGGCFKTYGSSADMAAMGDALKADGIATVNVEYRRLDQPGGGWPNTYLDVGSAIDSLRSLSYHYHLDLDHVVIVGHSAGGHLAMWAAGRSREPRGSALYVAKSLPVRGVIDLAGPLDLAANIDGYESLCRDHVITRLMGGTPQTAPEHYAQASPIRLLPLGIPQVIVLGEHEDFVPRPLAESYVEAARRAGDRVQLILIPGVGHFEIANPVASPWPQVRAAIRSLLAGHLPRP